MITKGKLPLLKCEFNMNSANIQPNRKKVLLLFKFKPNDSFYSLNVVYPE